MRRTHRLPKRNPIARALRDPAFRARAAANRRKYRRKRKHPAEAVE
jgi:hypothetical protein